MNRESRLGGSFIFSKRYLCYVGFSNTTQGVAFLSYF